MKRILIFAISTFICVLAFAQPMGMQPQSTYEQVDEVRKQMNLDHSQFEKVYSAYEKYNKAVFGNQSSDMMPPPAGGRPGGPMGPPPGNGRRSGDGAGFRGNHDGSHPDFNGRSPRRPDKGNSNGIGPKPEDIRKMKDKRAKQEEKLVKAMQKIFKKDPAAFSKWQSIRGEQLERMFRLHPNPNMPNNTQGE